MSATTDRVLTGARWSEAVRCKARATYQGLGTPPTDERPRWLDDAFDRGVPVGEIWGLVQGARLRAQGHEISLEHDIPWGLGWHGHADLADLTDAIIDEAFHSNQLEFREEKALQNAGYCIGQQEQDGREWRGVITAVNTADGDRNDGMKIKRFPIDVEGLRDQVMDIRERVIAAVQAGAVNPADKVSQTPQHPECQACVFKSLCHAGYTPPEPDEVVGLEDSFEALRITESDLHHAASKVEEIKARRDSLRDAIRPFTQVGVPVVSGGTLIRRSEVAGRVTFKLGDATKAGHAIPDTLTAFITEGKPSERWRVEAADVDATQRVAPRA